MLGTRTKDDMSEPGMTADIPVWSTRRRPAECGALLMDEFAPLQDASYACDAWKRVLHYKLYNVFSEIALQIYAHSCHPHQKEHLDVSVLLTILQSRLKDYLPSQKGHTKILSLCSVFYQSLYLGFNV